MNFDALFRQAQGLHQKGNVREALATYQQLLALQPKHTPLLYMAGAAHLQLEQVEAALPIIERLLSIQPNNSQAWSNLGYAQVRLNRLDEALLSCEKAIALTPGDARLYSNRGFILEKLKRFEAALTDYNRALELSPDFADAHYNRANTLHQLNRLDEALQAFAKTLAIKPHHVDALNNQGRVLHDQLRTHEALASYNQAIALHPRYAEAHWNKALSLLQLGEFPMGWALYEWRHQSKYFAKYKRDFAQPLWLGQASLQGQRILIYAEQGLGDSIQFSRYAKLLRDLGATVLLEVPQTLMGLFARLEGVSQLIEKGAHLPDFDYHCPLLSLPLAFKTTLSTIPSPQPYLSSQPAKVTAWQQRLGPQTKPRVGLVWRGNPEHQNDHNRSIALADICAHLPQEFAYVSLQKVVSDADQHALHTSGITHWGDALVDFADTAALCELMDVVISVDTSVAHLAAAIGRPTWIMLPHAPDWRWLLDREDSPWYTSVKLYRQGADWRWGRVMSRIAADLHALLR